VGGREEERRGVREGGGGGERERERERTGVVCCSTSMRIGSSLRTTSV
jgi:hypothetical protein